MSRYCILGASGMVGRAFCRALGDQVVMKYGREWEQDLTMEEKARSLGIDAIICCAAVVGGIGFNIDRPFDILRSNLRIATTVVSAALRARAKLVFLGSSCIYPRRLGIIPLTEDFLMAGKLEPTNEAYAVAKIAGIKLCEAAGTQYGLNWLAPMPCNLYGPHDRFDEQRGHLIPALVKRFVDAKESGRDSVTVWGTGTPRRECMHVDDCVAAIIHLLDRSATGVINVGTGIDHTVKEIAEIVAAHCHYSGKIEYDHSKPDGAARKLLDVSRLRGYKWDGARSLHAGIADTVAWYKQAVAAAVA